MLVLFRSELDDLLSVSIFPVQLQMNHNALRQTCDTLETFLLLKQQNNLIYAWMQLKKRNRRTASIQGSRSIYQSSSARNSARGNPNLNIVFPNAASTPQNLTPTKSFNHITPRIPRKEIRLATESYQPNQPEAFNTFHKGEGPRFTLTENHTARNHLSRQMHPQNEEADIEDSDEFEDIVLDRLSKLEENINRLMREKKQKEQKRGYVGAPLANPYEAAPLANSNFQRSPFLNYQSSQDDQEYLQQEKPKNTFGSILQRKQKFFESLQKKGEDSKNIVYNMKYIPVQRQNPQPNITNIQKIRHIIQGSQEEDNLIDNLDYFVTNNPRRQQDTRHYPIIRHEEFEQEKKGRNSTSLYLHRNGKEKDPRVHYAPSHHLERQTVIEPPSRRYFHRDGRSNQNGTNPHIQAQDEMKNSRASRNSEYSGKANNLSAYY